LVILHCHDHQIRLVTSRHDSSAGCNRNIKALTIDVYAVCLEPSLPFSASQYPDGSGQGLVYGARDDRSDRASACYEYRFNVLHHVNSS
jgi:hypothetical protein